MKFLRSLIVDRQATITIELAALLPITLALVYGATEASRYYFLENDIRSAASACIRHATNEREIDSADLRSAFFAAFDDHDSEVVSDLSFASETHTLASVDRLEVSVSYQFRPVTNLLLSDMDRTVVVRGLVPVDD